MDLDLAQVRAWAKQQAIIAASARGPLPHAAQVAYAQAHGLPEPEKPARAEKQKRERVLIDCSCGRKWEGLRECHCRGCHAHFRSPEGFDQHLVLGDDGETSVCRNPADIRYRSGKRKGYPKFRSVDAFYGPIFALGEERPEGLEFPAR